jgi:hypothetical protein
MKTFSEFMQDLDHELYSEIFGFGKNKKPKPTPTPEPEELPEEDPVTKYKRLRQQMQVTGDKDVAATPEEQNYLAKWKR